MEGECERTRCGGVRAGPDGKLQGGPDHGECRGEEGLLCWDPEARPTCGEGPLSTTTVLQRSAAASLQGRAPSQQGRP